MAEGGTSRVLTVEVCSARNLMPKDGQGTASAYVIVDFDGQRRRTKTKPRDLNPQWGEKLEFLVHDPDAMATETLEINIYNDKKAGRRSTFLGKVKLSGSAIAKAGSESLVFFPLEKRGVFSQVKGEIGLKVSYFDNAPPPPAADAPPEAEEKKAEEADKPAAEEKKAEGADKPAAEEPTAPPPPPPAAAAEEEKKPKAEEKPKEDLKTEAAADTRSKPPEAAVVVALSAARVAQHVGIGDLEIRPVPAERHRSSSYDLVDSVPYLFVRLLKTKHAIPTDAAVFAKLVIGSHTVRTRAVKSADWDQVFAFHHPSLNSTSLEISVWTVTEIPATETAQATTTEMTLGTVLFDLNEIPKRSPPADSPLAPQWYTLDVGGGAAPADIMLAVWIGTQADEAFPEAWQSDSGGLLVHTRSKAYLSPKLWYLRLTVIQTQDLRLPADPDPKPRPELIVKGQLGNQMFRTGRVPLCSSSSSANPSWNEDLIFVAAEPFDPFLTVIVEDATAGVPVGQAKVALTTVHRRLDDRAEPPPRWLNLAGDASRPYAGRVHVRVCLEGGYHVLDEAAHVASDARAASKQLSSPPIGLLEVGVRGAANLVPMKVAKDGSSGSTDAYVVLKYGPKWARTRTILDQFNPRWNEQYAWEVYDPCTVVTIAVFDNVRYKIDDKSAKDVRIGKVRIRLSTLDTNRVYRNSYPLTAVYPAGAKKMGEIELSVRFSCSSWLSLLQAYGSPMLPRMHYVRPLGPAQQDALRHTAMRIVSTRLARSEPPLGPEVVQHMLETDAHTWSMRRIKANWFRVVGCLSGVLAVAKWAYEVRMWVHSSTTILVHVLLGVVVMCPQMVLPTVFVYLVLVLAWRYRGRAKGPMGMDPRLSHVDAVGPDEFDEEFDGFPSSRALEVIRVRYDRLRALAGRAQTLLGDVAAVGERVEALMSWRDPRATGMFVVLCVMAAVVFYMVPFKVLVIGGGLFYLRHPRFRGDMPSMWFNFFRRLPSLADRLL